jgi:hypothetical protein
VTAIRPLERDDLPRIAALYELVMRSGSAQPLPELAEFFERTLFDHPWVDPDIPSLVYVDGRGDIVGLISSNTRRMRFDGRPIRMTCSAHLLAHPRARRLGVGALLMRAFLAGPQDLTITDGATDTVRRMWEGLGGQTVHLSALSFIRVFRPLQLTSDVLFGRRPVESLEAVLRPAWSALDLAAARLARKALVPHEPEGTVEPLTPDAMLEHLPVVTAATRLHPDYDRPYLEWLFAELEATSRRGPLWLAGVRRGAPWAELVRSEGQVLGWYVCHLRSGGFCRLLQLAAAEKSVATVVDQLVYRARLNGAAGLYGRLEPRLLAPLSEQRCVLRFAQGRLLVHSQNEDIVRAILSGSALLTRLDGEWW